MITRRDLLIGIGAFGAGSLAGLEGAKFLETADGLDDRFKQIVGLRAGARSGLISTEQRQSLPAGTTSADVVEILAKDLGWFTRYASEHELRERLVLRIKRDYREGRTMAPFGWVLSETEVWLAVLLRVARQERNPPAAPTG